eukprot:4493592-Alexandrium_andersonii.AAC.1
MCCVPDSKLHMGMPSGMPVFDRVACLAWPSIWHSGAFRLQSDQAPRYLSTKPSLEQYSEYSDVYESRPQTERRELLTESWKLYENSFSDHAAEAAAATASTAAKLENKPISEVDLIEDRKKKARESLAAIVGEGAAAARSSANGGTGRRGGGSKPTAAAKGKGQAKAKAKASPKPVSQTVEATRIRGRFINMMSKVDAMLGRVATDPSWKWADSRELSGSVKACLLYTSDAADDM